MPLYKKDDPHLVDNYRPISVLPAISKVFERVVFNQLYDYMHKNELLYVWNCFINTNLGVFPTISCLCSQTQLAQTITILDTTQF